MEKKREKKVTTNETNGNNVSACRPGFLRCNLAWTREIAFLILLLSPNNCLAISVTSPWTLDRFHEEKRWPEFSRASRGA